jgi:hypothetical protein
MALLQVKGFGASRVVGRLKEGPGRIEVITRG